MSGGARDPRPRPRFVMGTAYERLSAETAPVKVSTDTMRLIKQQRLTGKKLTNSERAILYNDEAVRLRKSDLLHKANELVGKPIYDTHDATKQAHIKPLFESSLSLSLSHCVCMPRWGRLSTTSSRTTRCASWQS